MCDIGMPWWWNHSPDNLYLADPEGKPAIRGHYLPYSDDKTPAAKGPAPDGHCPVCWVVNSIPSLSLAAGCAHAEEPHFLIWRKADRPGWGFGRQYGCLKARKGESHAGPCWVEQVGRVGGRWTSWPIAPKEDDGDQYRRYHARESIVPSDILQMAGKVAA